MAAVQQKLLVHKQFNSPLGLYSPQNIQATLDRELKAFGMNDRCNGIDSDEKISTRSLNLANSAVLRAVEEEDEEMKCGYKRVAWPPLPEERIVREFTPQPQGQFPPSQQQSQSPQMTTRAGGVTSPNTTFQPSNQKTVPSPQQQRPQQQYQAASSTQYNYQANRAQTQSHHQGVPQQQQQQQQQPLSQPQPSQQQQQRSHWAQPTAQPTAVLQQQRQQQQPPPLQQHQQQLQQQHQPQPYQAPSFQQPNQYQYNQQANQFDQNHYNSYSQPLQQQQQQLYPQDYRSDSPGIITLRKEAPISQKPAPVFTSQPAAVSFRGGSKMRGDLKWPPPEYKEQLAREEEERHQLQMGPAVRPTKIKRDYTDFFAKHRLNSYYPSYKVPPGTQHMTA